MKATAALLMGVVLAGPVRAAEADVKKAVEKGLKRIAQGVTSYPRHRQCFSCHHQAMAVLSMTAARKHGFAVDAELLQKQIDFSLRSFRHKTMIAKGQGVGGDSTSVAYALHTLAAVDREYDETTGALIEYLLVKQRKDGAWPIPLAGNRPPTMGSLFTNTGLAVYALRKYGPPKDVKDANELQKRIDTAIDKGRAWLLSNRPSSTEDRVFHLRGLVDVDADRKDIGRARADLLKEQRADGSWAQLASMSGDAYATATSLAALGHAGLDHRADAYQKGVKYLLASQKEDGAWIVQTRSRPLQPFFDNDDPGGKSQFISFAATNWSIIALAQTMPLADRASTAASPVKHK